MNMNEPERLVRLSAHVSISNAAETVGRVIVHAKRMRRRRSMPSTSSGRPLALSNEVVAKLVEAQQALFAAQRLLEAEF